MGLAIAILSTEQGRNTFTTIAASHKELAEVYGTINKHNTKTAFMTPDNPMAIQYIARAYEVLGDKWEAAHGKEC